MWLLNVLARQRGQVSTIFSQLDSVLTKLDQRQSLTAVIAYKQSCLYLPAPVCFSIAQQLQRGATLPSDLSECFSG